MAEWTEKYRPGSLKDIIGNRKARDDMRRWAESWLTGIPKKRAIVLMGDPGIGKTTAALALANDMGWQVMEMNASDTRNADAIMSIATQGALGETFNDSGEFLASREGRRKLIVLDEADNIFGREDFGGVRAIAQTILETKQPIILIVNDWYALKRRSSVIQGNVATIRFGKPSDADIVQLLRTISRKEGVSVPEEVLARLAERSGGDVRSALKDLQSLAEGREKLELKDISALGMRDTTPSIFKSVEAIFQTGNCKRASDIAYGIDENPETLILWIDHNIPAAYRSPGDIHSAYEMLSRADIFLGRVRRRQGYSLWAYARQMMSCGVALAKAKEYRGRINYDFPPYLIKMSRSKGLRATRDEFGAKLAKLSCTGTKRALQDILPYFKQIYAHDQEFRIAMTRRLNLQEEDVGFLLGAKPDSHPVRHVFDAMRKVDAVSGKEQKEEAPEEEVPKKKPGSRRTPKTEEEEIQEPKKEEKQQKSLFEFG